MGQPRRQGGGVLAAFARRDSLPEAEFTPAGVQDDDFFGTSVAIDGDRVIAGAPGHDLPGALDAGAAWIYERSGTAWAMAQKLVSDQPAAGETLGTSVALEGDFALVGGRDVAVLFERIGATWVQTERLTHSLVGVNFGNGVALDQDRMLVGSPDTQEVFAYTLESQASSTYCTAKLNSLGCLPSIGFSGMPSTTSALAFEVTATNVLSNKLGVLFYGTNGPTATPFLGGFQCVAPPRRRTPLQSSGGNPPPVDCSGTYAFDFNAHIQSGADPALVPGATVAAQYWTRDSGASFQTGMTDAVTFGICP